jgi:hypothetical protein
MLVGTSRLDILHRMPKADYSLKVTDYGIVTEADIEVNFSAPVNCHK